MFYALLAILQDANPVVVEIPKESKAGKFLDCEICQLLSPDKKKKKPIIYFGDSY